tara:strand:- start:179 stop:454 length:276 start_codon:yes stop_codon:yes gene_type:complete
MVNGNNLENDALLIQKRNRASQLSKVGRKIGYTLFFLSIVILAFGLAIDFNDRIATTLIVLLISGSVVLAPATLLHYAVRGAEREEKEKKH